MKSLFNPENHNRFRSNNSGAAALRTVHANATMSAEGW